MTFLIIFGKKWILEEERQNTQCQMPKCSMKRGKEKFCFWKMGKDRLSNSNFQSDLLDVTHYVSQLSLEPHQIKCHTLLIITNFNSLTAKKLVILLVLLIYLVFVR